MADLLARILAAKRREVEESRREVPEPVIRTRAEGASPSRGFAAALRASIAAGRPAVIAEIKRKSPSRGLIRADLDPARVAASYEAGGASCLSVLTDRDFFGGSAEDLRAARDACSLPVLRKDFIVDGYQVWEARAWGADCILLIVDAVADRDLHDLAALARRLGMDVLVECHDPDQLRRALAVPGTLVGINNRDLRTFQTRLETTLGLVSQVPKDRILVTESGIATPEDVARLQAVGVSAYLVGSALMEQDDPGQGLNQLFFPAD